MKACITAILLMVCTAAAAEDEAFSMPILDVFVVTGQGVIVTGRIEGGTVSLGDIVCLVSTASGASSEYTVASIELFRKTMETAKTGDHVGVFLEGLEKGAAERGDLLRERC